VLGSWSRHFYWNKTKIRVKIRTKPTTSIHIFIENLPGCPDGIPKMTFLGKPGHNATTIEGHVYVTEELLGTQKLKYLTVKPQITSYKKQSRE
jgi:hypothetical protein